jgi:hypothetical protein
MPQRVRHTRPVSFSARRAARSHACHAQIARRVTLSQAAIIYEIRNACFNPPTSPQHEGRFGQSSRHVGRDAMDAAAREMMRAGAYGQAVWFWLPDAGVNPRVKSPGGWWLTSPVHQEEHGAAVKPLRRECRSDFGVPVLTCVRVFCLHARPWVRRAPGIPCALSFLRVYLARLGRYLRRGNAETCLVSSQPSFETRPAAAPQSLTRNAANEIGHLLQSSSCPAVCRASTSSFQSRRKTWMAGSSPAMTKMIHFPSG